LFFLIHHETHSQTVKLWDDFLELYRFITHDVKECVNIESIFLKCRDWVRSFLDLGSKRQGYNTITPYLHCLAYHVPFFLNRFGKLVNYSGQGVEKINDDIKKIHQSKTNKYDATVDDLKVRKRIEYLKLDGCERTKRDYTKSDERYWDEEIYSQSNAKKK